MDTPFKPGDLVVFRGNEPWTGWVEYEQDQNGGPGPYKVVWCEFRRNGRTEMLIGNCAMLYDADYFKLAPRGED